MITSKNALKHRYPNRFQRLLKPGSSKYYYSKADYYKRIVNQNTDIDSILATYGKADIETTLETQTEITFSRTIKFGSSIQEVKAKMSTPNFVMENCPMRNCDIHIYRIKLGKFKVKLILHYYKERLFFYSYMFSRLTKDDKKELYDILSSKYLNYDLDPAQLNSITDNKGNYVLIDNHCYFTISYFTRNGGFYEKISKIKHYRTKFESKRDKFRIREVAAML